MNEPDRPQRLAAVLGILGEAYRQKITPFTIKAYAMGLEGVPIGAVEQATKRALASSTFMPVPAELRKLAGELEPADRAVLAWGAFLKAWRQHNYYTSVDFDDKLINATIHNLGGWIGVVDRLETEDTKWFRKDFERIYVAFMRSGIGAEQAKPLMGWYDKDNALIGYREAIKPPTTIRTGLPLLGRDIVRLPKPKPAEQVSIPLLKGVD